MSERIPLCVDYTILKKKEGEGAAIALGTAGEQCRHIRTLKQTQPFTYVYMHQCPAHTNTLWNTVHILCYFMSHVKMIKMSPWLRAQAGNLMTKGKPNTDEEDVNGKMKRKTGFLFFHLCLSMSLSLPPPLSLSQWGYPFLPSTPSTSISLSPSTHFEVLALCLSLSPSLFFLPLLMCLLKLSGLLLTPSSSTQPTHSVLWDELWLILSLLPSPSSLVT